MIGFPFFLVFGFGALYIKGLYSNQLNNPCSGLLDEISIRLATKTSLRCDRLR